MVKVEELGLLNRNVVLQNTSPWKIHQEIDWQLQRRRLETVTHLLDLKKCDILLDVGCGEGFQLDSMVPSLGYAVGVDLQKSKLVVAKKNISNECEFLVADCRFLPFCSNAFSKVICLELLEHVDNPDTVVSEVDRCMKKDGNLIISTPNDEHIVTLQCPHCQNIFPLFGHLHSFSVKNLIRLLSPSFITTNIVYIVNPATVVSVFKHLPFQCWLFFNNLFNKFFGRIGYWVVLRSEKRYKKDA